jgi:hypothetical protein
VTGTPRLQFQRMETLYHPDGGDWSKTRWEAEASWSTPLGKGRYRISEERSWRGSGGLDVIRLTPTTAVLKGSNKPRKWHGYNIRTVTSDNVNEAVTIAEADNAKRGGAS